VGGLHGADSMEASHTILPAENNSMEVYHIILSREDGAGGLHAIHPRQGLPIAAAVTFTQIGVT
jgi:hypothetical protein